MGSAPSSGAVAAWPAARSWARGNGLGMGSVVGKGRSRGHTSGRRVAARPRPGPRRRWGTDLARADLTRHHEPPPTQPAGGGLASQVSQPMSRCHSVTRYVTPTHMPLTSANYAAQQGRERIGPTISSGRDMGHWCVGRRAGRLPASTVPPGVPPAGGLVVYSLMLLSRRERCSQERKTLSSAAPELVGSSRRVTTWP